jgi:hypothetical protein
LLLLRRSLAAWSDCPRNVQVQGLYCGPWRIWSGTRYIVSHDFTVAGNIGRHYGPSAQHGLNDNKRQTYSTRRQYKGMMLAPDILDNGMMAGKGHFPVDLQPCGEALERIA